MHSISYVVDHSVELCYHPLPTLESTVSQSKLILAFSINPAPGLFKNLLREAIWPEIAPLRRQKRREENSNESQDNAHNVL